MASRYFTLLAVFTLLFLTAGVTAHAETLTDTYVSTTKKNFGTNETFNQRSGRDSVTNKTKNYAERSMRYKKNKNNRTHRRDGRLNQKKQAISDTGVNH